MASKYDSGSYRRRKRFQTTKNRNDGKKETSCSSIDGKDTNGYVRFTLDLLNGIGGN